MEQFTPLQNLILRQLQDGLVHSAASLAQILQIPPESVQEIIGELITFGFAINTLDKEVWQWTVPLILLDKALLQSTLILQNPYDLHVFSTIDSTNRYLKSRNSSPRIAICCAEKQSQGRGRFGRYWHSPCAENIYCSSRWPMLRRDLSGLSLVVSLALLRVLEDFGIPDLQIKWPNDILWKDKKLSGILIEILEGEMIIGIGINVNSDTLNHPLPDKVWCSLFEITGKYFDRNRIIALMLMKLETYLQRFWQKGFPDFMTQWQRYDYLSGKNIRISESSGLCLGVHHTGAMILEDPQKNLHYIDSGEALS